VVAWARAISSECGADRHAERNGRDFTAVSGVRVCVEQRKSGARWLNAPTMNHLDTTKEILVQVLDGHTYAVVGKAHGLGKTAVEKRTKTLVERLVATVGVEGMNSETVLTADRLRAFKAPIIAAMARFDPQLSYTPRPPMPLEALSRAVAITRARSSNPNRDVALLFVLFSTGAKPIEIARLEVRDYLNRDGSVREESVMRAEAAVNGLERPLYFRSSRARQAIDNYLGERVRRGFGASSEALYRGLSPGSRLFLSEAGEPFEVVTREASGRGRHLCRSILEVYRAIFRRAGLKGVTTMTARRAVARRLRERGAEDDQIGELLGIKNLGALRELLDGCRRPLAAVVEELV
jgi:integrase